MSQPASTHSAEPETPAHRWWDRLRTLGWKGLLAAVVAFVVTVGTFTEALDGVFDRSINICRTMRICDPLPPPVLVGTLSEVRLGAAHLTQREAYSERDLAVPSNLSQQDGEWPGQLVTYRVEFQGLEKAVCRVKWTLYDATTGKRVPNGTGGWQTIHTPAFPDGNWTVEAHQTDVNVGLVWVPHVGPGTFIVEIELLNPENVHLDLERTEQFEILPEDVPQL